MNLLYQKLKRLKRLLLDNIPCSYCPLTALQKKHKEITNKIDIGTHPHPAGGVRSESNARHDSRPSISSSAVLRTMINVEEILNGTGKLSVALAVREATHSGQHSDAGDSASVIAFRTVICKPN